jgi:outer membrane protein assembly complex protein YaeT
MQGRDGVCRTKTRLTAAKGLGVLVFLALAALATPPGGAQTTPGTRVLVADVIVTGNRTISTDRIMSYIKIRPGLEYTRTFLKQSLIEDARRLSDTRMFKNIWPQVKDLPDGKVTVCFVVQEFPNVIKEIKYKGANHISQKDLDQMTNLRVGLPLDPVSNKKACFEIEDALKKKGRFFAHVELEEGANPTDNRVIFNITEGPVVKIHGIRFKGNKELATSARLATQIDTKKPFLGIFGGKFIPQIVDGDVANLEKYYKANGYLDVRVTREVVLNDDFRTFDIVFHIHEGQRYRVENVTVEGPQQLSRDQVSSIIGIHKGDYYTEGAVDKDLHNIADLYGWRGYAVQAKKELYYPEPGLVRVVYEVAEQPPARVGQIIVVGNEVTQDRVIRRVLGLYPGQILRYPELRIAENDLSRLGIFNTDPEKGIRPTLTVLETDSEFKDVLVTVQEQPTGSLMFGAGINSNAGLIGSIVLNEKNFDLFRPPTSLADIFEGRAFRGAGQEFRVEAMPGTQIQRYTASLREPYLFDLPYSLTTSGYYYQRLFPEYIEGREGIRFTLAHQLSRAWSVNAGLRVENINVSHLGQYLSSGTGLFSSGIPNANPSAPPIEYTSVLGNNFLAAPRIGASWNTTDSYMRPTEGGIMDVAFEEGFGSFTFPIVNMEASRYFTTYQRPDGSGRHVFAVRSHVGFAGANTPVYESFFAGGFQSIRGFQFRGVGPRINGFNTGGDFLFLNGAEYQIPIKANDQLYLVAFCDTGTVERRVEIMDYRVTAGVGMRITIPMMGPVPIAIDFGFPIVKSSQDVTQIFNFWVGVFR